MIKYSSSQPLLLFIITYRNIFNRQKTLLVENIQQAQTELSSIKGELEREQNDKEETKKKNQTLLTENRQLMDK